MIFLVGDDSVETMPPMMQYFEAQRARGGTSFRTLDDCASIIERADGTRKAAVIGCGLLGLEVARALMNRGLEVDVVHLMGWSMDTQLDPRSGRLLQQSLEHLGARFHLEKLTTAVLGDGYVTGSSSRTATRWIMTWW